MSNVYGRSLLYSTWIRIRVFLITTPHPPPSLLPPVRDKSCSHWPEAWQAEARAVEQQQGCCLESQTEGRLGALLPAGKLAVTDPAAAAQRSSASSSIDVPAFINLRGE